MLYKLDTMKRRESEGATSASSTPNGTKQKAAPPPEPEIKKPVYTQVQARLANEIIWKKNYYEILGV